MTKPKTFRARPGPKPRPQRELQWIIAEVRRCVDGLLMSPKRMKQHHSRSASQAVLHDQRTRAIDTIKTFPVANRRNAMEAIAADPDGVMGALAELEEAFADNDAAFGRAPRRGRVEDAADRASSDVDPLDPRGGQTVGAKLDQWVTITATTRDMNRVYSAVARSANRTFRGDKRANEERRPYTASEVRRIMAAHRQFEDYLRCPTVKHLRRLQKVPKTRS